MDQPFPPSFSLLAPSFSLSENEFDVKKIKITFFPGESYNFFKSKFPFITPDPSGFFDIREEASSSRSERVAISPASLFNPRDVLSSTDFVTVRSLKFGVSLHRILIILVSIVFSVNVVEFLSAKIILLTFAEFSFCKVSR